MGRSDELARDFEQLNNEIRQTVPQVVPLLRRVEQAVVENTSRLDEIEKMLHA